MMAKMDLPPVWLGLALGVVWGSGLVWGRIGLVWPGVGLIVAGVGLMGVAVAQMLRARTSFVPRRTPTALVTAGVFGVSRNPIYLGDAMVLTGAVLGWGAVVALTLVPLFMLLITHKYIKDEEARLRAGFGAEFDRWAAVVPRWIWPF